MNIRFTPEARRHLLDIRSYIAKDNENAAGNVMSRIRQTIMIFERFPLLGREGHVPGTREFSIPSMSYTIIYRIASETELQILGVIHQRMQYPSED
ncbi:type II toxin-antitoxin system RelE/ParE family toxin [Asticcacaulis biprosthecium]|nr:type II toxin-antitoxin system RelE/ParE family toxin [Asticcacaulis biprosthecium]